MEIQCLTMEQFGQFLEIAQLAYEMIGDLILVKSEQPAFWQLVGDNVCVLNGAEI